MNIKLHEKRLYFGAIISSYAQFGRLYIYLIDWKLG